MRLVLWLIGRETIKVQINAVGTKKNLILMKSCKNLRTDEIQPKLRWDWERLSPTHDWSTPHARYPWRSTLETNMVLQRDI